MLLGDIYKILDGISPFELQESWDNSGLQIGSSNKEISKIYIALDVERDLIERIEQNSLLIAHHPLIFKPLKNIVLDSYPGNLIETMIKKDIAMIAMHTNFDKTHLNRYVLEHVLGFEVIESNDFVLIFGPNCTFESLKNIISKKLNLQTPKIVIDDRERFIKRCALTTGSGASLLPTLSADCFLTGDIKYHDAMLAKSLGVSMIDIGHFESERYFGDALQPLLEKNLENSDLLAIITDSFNPFSF